MIPLHGGVIPKRVTATLDGTFCVFLIGMRFNRPWKFYQWLPVFVAMPRMLAELQRHPELGYLGGHGWFGRTVLMLQYWRSPEALMNYATARDREHLPAWQQFTRLVGNSGDVGIWHETYVVKGGEYETIYHNMPPFGLGKVGDLHEATGHRMTSAQRRGGPTAT